MICLYLRRTLPYKKIFHKTFYLSCLMLFLVEYLHVWRYWLVQKGYHQIQLPLRVLNHSPMLLNSCFSSENLSHSSCLFSQSKPILAVFLCIDSATSKAGESQFIFSNREWCSTLCFSSAFSSSHVFSFSLFPNTWGCR